MNKGEARQILNEYVKSPMFTNLPITDEVIYRESSNGEVVNDSDSAEGSFCITEWTFKGLLKLAYDL